jgi:hypothetical protein
MVFSFELFVKSHSYARSQSRAHGSTAGADGAGKFKINF